ncbi:MAG: hypothetical protein ACR2M1_00300 [Gemmatimonadaceae bacterium]
MEVGVRLLNAIHIRHRNEWQWRTPQIDRLAGSDALRTAVEAGNLDMLVTRWNAEAIAFARRRASYLLYP